jgi:hypothetical protein
VEVVVVAGGLMLDDADFLTGDGIGTVFLLAKDRVD